MAAGVGLSSDCLLEIPYFPMTAYNEMVKELGSASSLADYRDLRTAHIWHTSRKQICNQSLLLR